MADNVAANAMNGIEGAKEAFKNMIKDKNKWLMLYLILIIIMIYKFSTLENFFLSFGSRYLFLNRKFLGVTSNNSSELM